MRTLSAAALGFLLILLAACAAVLKPSPAELAALDTPPPAVRDKVDRLTPAALAWLDSVKPNAATGRPLSDAETAFARKIGVKNPELVRVVVVEVLPMPEDDELRKEAASQGMGSILEGGRTMGNVILLKPRYATDVEVITHELTHVAQYQRMGPGPMVRRYMTEMIMLSYPRMPMELEAYQNQTNHI